MVMFPLNPGGMAGSSAGAAGAAGSAGYPGSHNKSSPAWDDNDGSWDAGSGGGNTNGGFSYQGKAYDPVLNEPMEVSAEMHGNYWK